MRQQEDWRLEERIVALIEKAIQPDATVQHDVTLREAATGVVRQCDVVIWTGPPERRRLSIVEVQKRERPVGIAELEGWVAKRDALGAHALICVSLHPFGDSLKKKAEVDGRTTLISFRNLEAAEWPLLLNQVPFTFTYRTIAGVDDLHLESPELPPADYPDVRNEDRAFLRGDDKTLLTMREILQVHYSACIEAVPEENGIHSVPFVEEGLQMQRTEGLVGVRMRGVVKIRTSKFPIEQRSVRVYEQQDSDPSYWLSELKAPVEGREYRLGVLVKPINGHSMGVHLASVQGMVEGDQVSLKII